jgi:hypothetical protein
MELMKHNPEKAKKNDNGHIKVRDMECERLIHQETRVK